MVLRRVEPDEFDWCDLERYGDRNFVQSREWLEFLISENKGEPVFGVLEAAGRECGFFVGLIVRRLGIPILASPFPRWDTPFMGFMLEPGRSRRAALAALPQFAFEQCGCEHVVVTDPYLGPADAERCGFEISSTLHHVTDLSGGPDELRGLLSKSVRRYARQAQRNGLVVEEGRPEGFAEEYYEHVLDVFNRQGLPPPHSLEHVQRLVDACYPSGNLLLLRVLDPDGNSIATAISMGVNGLAYGWGTASKASGWHLHPNELLFTHELFAWQERGATEFDWGPAWNYKPKYGATEVTRWHMHRSRRAWMRLGRHIARNTRTAVEEIRRRRQPPPGALPGPAGG